MKILLFIVSWIVSGLISITMISIIECRGVEYREVKNMITNNIFGYIVMFLLGYISLVIVSIVFIFYFIAKKEIVQKIIYTLGNIGIKSEGEEKE